MAAAWVGSSIILVSPRAAFARFFVLARGVDFWAAVGSSMGRILTGFALAVGTGILTAAGTAANRVFRRIFTPAINVMNAMPLASFVLLLLFLLPRENISLAVAFVMVLPVIYRNVYEGIRNTDTALLEMAQLFRVPLRKKITHIYTKATAPYLFSAMGVGIGIAWKSGISAELIGAVRGTVGGHLHRAQVSIATADMFAWTIAIVTLSYAIDRGFSLLAKRRGGKAA
jgi:NitT/TauT family transport system permease protein